MRVKEEWRETDGRRSVEREEDWEGGGLEGKRHVRRETGIHIFVLKSSHAEKRESKARCT